MNGASGIIARLGGVKKGMTGMAVRSMFLACVRPIFEYGFEVWNFAVQAKDRDKFRSIQGNCLRRALGAVRTSPFEVLEIKADTWNYSWRIRRHRMLELEIQADTATLPVP